MKFIKKIHQWIKKKSTEKVKGTSAVEFIFFIIILSVLLVFCVNNYQYIHKFYKQYSSILNKKKKQMDDKIKEIEEEIDQLDQEE
jgi:cell division protein FtsB